MGPRALALKERLEERDGLRDVDPVLGSVPASLVTNRLLSSLYPTSRLSEAALWRLAQLYDELRKPELAAAALSTLVT
jgi:hypothetical protein